MKMVYIYIYIISNFDSQFRKIKLLFFNGFEVLFYLGFLKGEKLSYLQGWHNCTGNAFPEL